MLMLRGRRLTRVGWGICLGLGLSITRKSGGDANRGGSGYVGVFRACGRPLLPDFLSGFFRFLDGFMALSLKQLEAEFVEALTGLRDRLSEALGGMRNNCVTHFKMRR